MRTSREAPRRSTGRENVWLLTTIHKSNLEATHYERTPKVRRTVAHVNSSIETHQIMKRWSEHSDHSGKYLKYLKHFKVVCSMQIQDWTPFKVSSQVRKSSWYQDHMAQTSAKRNQKSHSVPQQMSSPMKSHASLCLVQVYSTRL